MGRINFFLTKNGIIQRKQNTIYFVYKEGVEVIKKPLPIEKIYSIYCYGNVTVRSGALSYLMKLGVPVHFFNKFGFYEGSFWPRETLVSGFLVVKQAEHYLDKEKRLQLAKEFVEGSVDNLVINLNYYDRMNGELAEEIEKIEELKKGLASAKQVTEIMAIEGNIREIYYKSWNKFLPQNFQFDKRTRMPPTNMINALISFGNSLVYSTCLTEIYNTQLNPTISYLHEPEERRFSLALDLAEIFKPLFTDRIIFKLVNKQIINEGFFEKELNYCMLNSEGKRIFLEEYNSKLDTTIKHRGLNRNVSYKRLIRLECYKMIKHFVGLQNYKAFRIWW